MAFATLSAALFLSAAPAFSQEVVKIVVGYPPGSATDNIARLVAEKMTAISGKRYIIDNLPGASGNVGAAAVARAAGDGTTILLTSDNPITTNIHLFKSIGFDPLNDLKPITIAANNIIALAVHPSLPVDNLEEFIAYAKENPGKLHFASSGVGSPHHLAGEQLKSMASIDLGHVPYKGGGPALSDLAGGHVQVSFSSVSGAIPLAEADRVRLLAITEPERYGALPDVPAMAETLPGYVMSSWIGYFAPGSTPDNIVAELNDTIAKALQDQDLKERLLGMGLIPVANSPEEAREVVVADLELRGNLVRESGATLD
ncbi:MAG: Bug family tripartite tricarboxylate transporter substrate binding protein [Pigmentiphaga sp.]